MRTSVITEALSSSDKNEIKGMIKAQLLALFYKLYMKKSFWS